MNKITKKINFREFGILYALIAFWIAMLVTNRYFRSWDNISSITREAGFYGITAIGMTFVIASKSIDLSVGSSVALVGIVCVMLVDTYGIPLSILVGLAAGALIGLINGLLTIKLRIPSFIATLGMLNIIKSISWIITGGPPVTTQHAGFVSLGNESFAGIPIPFWIFLACTAIGILLMKRSQLGRYTLAIGDSVRAAFIAGIKTDKVSIGVMVMLGICTAISGILLSSRLWSSNAEMKSFYEIDIITIVIMGGCLPSGGKGSILNTFIATIFFVSIANAMNNYHVYPYWQYIIKGLILLMAFAINNVRQIVVDWVQLRKKGREQR